MLEEGRGPGTIVRPHSLGHPRPTRLSPLSPSAASAKEDAKWLQWVTRQFEMIAGEDGETGLQESKRALNAEEARAHLGMGPWVRVSRRTSSLVCRARCRAGGKRCSRPPGPHF